MSRRSDRVASAFVIIIVFALGGLVTTGTAASDPAASDTATTHDLTDAAEEQTPAPRIQPGSGQDAPDDGNVTILEHVQPQIVKLEPGASKVYELTFEGGPFTSGWVFVITGKMAAEAGSVVVALEYLEDGVPRIVKEWTWTDGSTRQLTTLMPWDGFYRLVLHNQQDKETGFAFFYDQSCNCAAKPIPVEVPRGLVVFNVDVQEGDTWRAIFPEPPVHKLAVILTARLNERSAYPDDFGALGQSTEATLLPDGRRAHALEWTAPETTRFYVFITPTATNASNIDRSSPPQSVVMSVMVIPSFEKIADAAEAPAPPVITVVASLLGLALLATRRIRHRL